jgi:hypothetical protein
MRFFLISPGLLNNWYPRQLKDKYSVQKYAYIFKYKSETKWTKWTLEETEDVYGCGVIILVVWYGNSEWQIYSGCILVFNTYCTSVVSFFPRLVYTACIGSFSGLSLFDCPFGILWRLFISVMMKSDNACLRNVLLKIL